MPENRTHWRTIKVPYDNLESMLNDLEQHNKYIFNIVLETPDNDDYNATYVIVYKEWI